MDNNMLQTRRYNEEVRSSWSAYSADAEKILASNAYARIHDKTQVVYLLPHDHITNRGLHVQLVSLFARNISFQVGLDIALTEAISLGHDLGHPPFGHEGELYLSHLSEEKGLGSFSHAVQACRLAEEIEPMNLTLAVLDGFLSHDGGMKEKALVVEGGCTWLAFEAKRALREKEADINVSPMTKEGELVKLCDTICYVARDIEDAVKLGLIKRDEVPKTVLGNTYMDFVSRAAEDIIINYRAVGVVSLSAPFLAALNTLRDFNFDRIYYHTVLKTESKKIESAYRLLFENLLDGWISKGRESLLWTHFLHSKTSSYVEGTKAMLMVRDFISGMTDGYFLRLFEELFFPRTIEVPHVLPFHR